MPRPGCVPPSRLYLCRPSLALTLAVPRCAVDDLEGRPPPVRLCHRIPSFVFVDGSSDLIDTFIPGFGDEVMPFRQRCFTQKDKNPIDPLKKDCGFSWSKLDGISDYFQTEHVASLKPKTLPDAFRQDQTPRLIDMYG